MNHYTVRSCTPGDEDAVLTLHNRSFTGHQDRGKAHWDWKFHANPLKRTELMVAMTDDGRCVGVYSGIPQRIVINGKPTLGGNHIDVAIDPALRRGMRGARLLVTLARQYFADFAGGERELIWGFPEPALHRVGVRLVKFEVLRDVVFLLREPASVLVIPQEIEVRVVSRFSDDVNALWLTCCDEIGTGTVRNEEYLNWRYADHPDHPHLLLEAREKSTGKLRGVTALREGGWDEAIVSMMDWLVPLDDRDAEAALVRYALMETARRGKQYLACWFPVPRIQFNRFQRDHAFFAHATPYQECFRPYRKGLDRRWLDQHWYQTMGDIDFF